MSALPRVQSAVQGQIPCGHVARHPLQSLQGAPLREPVGAGGLLRAVCVGRGLVQRPLLLRALAQRVSRGGNCTNTLVVLSQLGHHCSWGGVLVDEPDASRIVADLDAHAIDLTPVRRLPKGKVPTSYITLNQRNGSRSIVHYRDLPEYDFDAFATIDLGACDWLHFEGRNIDETARMLAHARRTQPHIPRSVELEKPRAEIERLFADATLLQFSRAYVHARGGDEPAAYLRGMRLCAGPRRRSRAKPGLSAAARRRLPGRRRHLQRRHHRCAAARSDACGRPHIGLPPRGDEILHRGAQLFPPFRLESRHRPHKHRTHARSLRPPRLHPAPQRPRRLPARRGARQGRAHRRQSRKKEKNQRRPPRGDAARRRSAPRLFSGGEPRRGRSQQCRSNGRESHRGAAARRQTPRRETRARRACEYRGGAVRAQDGRPPRGGHRRREVRLMDPKSMQWVGPFLTVLSVVVFVVSGAIVAAVIYVVRRAKRKAAAEEAERAARRRTATTPNKAKHADNTAKKKQAKEGHKRPTQQRHAHLTAEKLSQHADAAV